MVNKVILVGNIGKDAESVSDSVTKFTLATTDHWTDKQTNQRVEKTEWHRVTVLGKLAPIMLDLCKKGKKAYIEGKLQTREWEKDGEKRYSTDVVVDLSGRIELFGGNEKSDSGNSNYTPSDTSTAPKSGKTKEAPAPREQSTPAPAMRAPEPEPVPEPAGDDDIPF